MEMPFTTPVVLAALVGALAALGGSIATAIVTRKRDVGETALKALTILVEKQEKTVTRLETKVNEQAVRLDSLDTEIESQRKRHRVLSEKYSVSLTYILSLWTSWAGLRVRLRQVGFVHGEPPPIPEIIAVDMEHPPEPLD